MHRRHKTPGRRHIEMAPRNLLDHIPFQGAEVSGVHYYRCICPNRNHRNRGGNQRGANYLDYLSSCVRAQLGRS